MDCGPKRKFLRSYLFKQSSTIIQFNVLFSMRKQTNLRIPIALIHSLHKIVLFYVAPKNSNEFSLHTIARTQLHVGKNILEF